ncbi:hypothetical protein PHYC_03045 [Phycisphaerales bacterium]|nr:hypothetical protein PHYC_03045 [Phycisphaerales bacterium]
MPDQFLFHSDYSSDWLPHHEHAAKGMLPWAVYSSHPATYPWTQGTVVWLVTIPPGPGAGPALCGRLVVSRMKVNYPGVGNFDARYASSAIGFEMDRSASRYVRPIPCPALDEALKAVSGPGPLRLPDAITAELERLWSSALLDPLH